MGKGKTSVNRRPAHEQRASDAESKENKQAKQTTCQGQATIQSCLNAKKVLQKNPLGAILEENSSKESSKLSEGVHIGGPKEPICDAPKDSMTKNQTKSGQKRTSDKPTDKKLKSKDSGSNRKVTDFYPVRRSCRKSEAELKGEKQRHIDDLIRSNVEKGLKVKCMEGKGRGVFAARAFLKDQFVVEYHGDLLEISDAKAREAQYAVDPSTGCYMYYFRFHDKNYCVDATMETNRLGRLINHSKNGNLQTKLHEMDGRPHLIFLASRNIREEEELLYDYGDRSKEAIAAHPWLKH
ncbi:hypothetical protein DNTS_002301 [Danionella cerebrum]|uniref:[histone H4]-lysine(20) N-methyltransferase n=1 Tax=Danionella cerebrum TaxID=2873325 RepID=A0A553MSX9_9TELE|nr:hypothetical protein DNTS_002301 [Danionella translucida]